MAGYQREQPSIWINKSMHEGVNLTDGKRIRPDIQDCRKEIKRNSLADKNAKHATNYTSLS